MARWVCRSRVELRSCGGVWRRVGRLERGCRRRAQWIITYCAATPPTMRPGRRHSRICTDRRCRAPGSLRFPCGATGSRVGCGGVRGVGNGGDTEELAVSQRRWFTPPGVSAPTPPNGERHEMPSVGGRQPPNTTGPNTFSSRTSRFRYHVVRQSSSSTPPSALCRGLATAATPMPTDKRLSFAVDRFTGSSQSLLTASVASVSYSIHLSVEGVWNVVDRTHG
jgi:hypothetical protein